MVGTRIEPDDNDIVVWKLDEATAPFVNSSTSSSAPSHAISDLATISGNVMTQQPSLFAASGNNSCAFFTGNNSGSPRNFISGANNFLPQPPMTFSGWLFLRNYDTTGFTQHLMTKQTVTGQWSGNFASVSIGNRRYAGLPQHVDFYLRTQSGSDTGPNAIAVGEYTIPLNTWSHVGLTYDGTTLFSYINGNLVSSSTASPGTIFYSATPGPWFFGAIPSGSGNPEESVISVCDVRVANIVRPLSYFQNIYRQGALNGGSSISIITKFYKLRAYDPIFTNQAVYWVDTEVSYRNAPASPSGSSLGPIEVMESWNLLNF
jgi:hypothetical protein